MRAAGFTLIEFAIILAIVGVLIAVGIPAYSGYIDRSRILQSRIDVGEIAKEIKLFERRTGRLPNSLAELPSTAVVPNDPWGKAYFYLDLRSNPVGMARKDKSAAPINSDFDLYSAGKDGGTELQLNRPVSRDDIVRARDGAFVGLAEEFDP
jgi:general secretion pathway protein G